MTASYLTAVPAALYALSVVLAVRATPAPKPPSALNLSRLSALLGVSLHGLNLFVATQTQGQYHLAVTDSASLVGWVMALNAIALMWVPGLKLFPAVILSVGGSLSILTGLLHGFSEPQPAWELAAHIALAALAFAWFAIASLAALCLMWVHRRLQRRAPLSAFALLPPLETLERLLFQALTGGFIALSLALLTGFFYVTDPHSQHLWHKIVFTVLAWLSFAILLIGRIRYGWRAKRVLRFTLFGVANLLIGYFGSKFVLENLLGRHWG
jgi:ABC-type uncharacterized transport system permease subunit